jgi:hypothetical protein
MAALVPAAGEVQKLQHSFAGRSTPQCARLLRCARVLKGRKFMARTFTLTLTTMVLLCVAFALPAHNAVAQQKQQVSFKAAAENNKITQHLNIEAGDVPNHIVRVFEVHNTYPNNAPIINGLKCLSEIILSHVNRL